MGSRREKQCRWGKPCIGTHMRMAMERVKASLTHLEYVRDVTEKSEAMLDEP